MTTAVR